MGAGLLTPIDSDTHVASSMSGSLLISLSLALFTSPFTLLGEDLYLDWLVMWMVLHIHTRAQPRKARVEEVRVWPLHLYLFICQVRRISVCVSLWFLAVCHRTVSQMRHSNMHMFVTEFIKSNSRHILHMVVMVGVVWFAISLAPVAKMNSDSRYRLNIKSGDWEKKWLSLGKISYRWASK